MNRTLKFLPEATDTDKEALFNSLGLKIEAQEGGSVKILSLDDEEINEIFTWLYQAASISPASAFNVDKTSLFKEGDEPEVTIETVRFRLTAPNELISRVRNHLEKTGRLGSVEYKPGEATLEVKVIDNLEVNTFVGIIHYMTGSPEALKVLED